MKYGKQPVYCNACGKRCFVETHKMVGRTWMVCSVECNETMYLRTTESTMGFDYGHKKPCLSTEDGPEGHCIFGARQCSVHLDREFKT